MVENGNKLYFVEKKMGFMGYIFIFYNFKYINGS